MMKKYVLICGTILAIITAVAAVTTLSYTPTRTMTSPVSWAVGYNSEKSLTNGADAIVMGTVVSGKTYEVYYNDDHSIIFTNYTIAVSQVYKGEVADNIIIKQTGGNFGDTIYQVDDDPLLPSGTQMILFLKQFGPESYFIIGGPQGRFHLVDSKVYSVGELYSSAAGTTSLLKTSGISLSDFVKQINP